MIQIAGLHNRGMSFVQEYLPEPDQSKQMLEDFIAG